MEENTTDKSYEEKAIDYFQQNPGNYGWILIVLGVVLLYGSIKRWGWIFEGDGRLFNIAWVAQTFGYKTAQTLFAILSIIFIATGIAWIFAYKK